MAKSTIERRQDRDAEAGNFRVHMAALTQHVLRQGSSLMTSAEARAEAVRLYQRGLRAGDVRWGY